MKYFGTLQGEQHKYLNKIIRNEKKLDEAKELFLDIHAKMHLSKATNTSKNEIDSLFEDMKDEEYRALVSRDHETIIWCLWHLARIEDCTMNILVNQGTQIFDESWKSKINVSITDTGNALNEEEMMKLSKEINIKSCIKYRNQVAKQTRKIVEGLTTKDMTRKIRNEDIMRIKDVGGVTEQEDSIWLLDYWGSKDVAGLLLMPPTRHAILHLNDCCKWKEHMRSGKKVYRHE